MAQIEQLEQKATQQTYWRRVRFGGDETNPPWELREEEGRGLVAYSTRNIKQGELICVEFPAVWIHGHHPFSPEQVQEIEEKVSALCEEDKVAFYAMANVFEQDSNYTKATGIFMTNCFDMTDSIYGQACAMYLAFARLNHSCTPNAQQTHIPETTEEVLYASRDINIGEEINDCYIDLRQNRQQRRQDLFEYYCFECHCDACIQSDPIQDQLREQTAQFQDQVVEYIENNNGEEEDADIPCTKAVNYALRMLQQLETIEAIKWSIRYLPEIYWTIYQLYFTQEDYIQAGVFLQKCIQLTILLQGERTPESKRRQIAYKEYLKKYGKRAKLKRK
jgi:hypothetical protein